MRIKLADGTTQTREVLTTHQNVTIKKDELLRTTKQGCYMSTIDLRAGYWQVQVRPSDRDKTAFITPLEIAQPLTKLTRKKMLWTWGAEQQNAFSLLKTKLTSGPILVQPDYDKLFIIRSDASNYALGACLLQGQEECPIEYASRLMIPAETRYSTTEREALAVVWAVEKFRGYIDGHQVVVRSDHQPLVLFSM